jgi:hypothetical protein
MNTRFDESAGWEVKEYFSEFYDKRGRFFEIVHKGQEIGFVGVRPVQSERFQEMRNNTCEMEVYIFPQYRNTFTKGLVFDVLDFPKTLTFKRGVMTTTRPTLLKLFQTLLKKGILETKFVEQKQIFIRTYS